ncbi:hypothetical protein B0H13DRAFT_1862891 [Mycena leptocephala]|nr:hypothetical protein B0H13DRAFT_1862891 [Mycena leptocephala]
MLEEASVQHLNSLIIAIQQLSGESNIWLMYIHLGTKGEIQSEVKGNTLKLGGESAASLGTRKDVADEVPVESIRERCGKCRETRSCAPASFESRASSRRGSAGHHELRAAYSQHRRRIKCGRWSRGVHGGVGVGERVLSEPEVVGSDWGCRQVHVSCIAGGTPLGRWERTTAAWEVASDCQGGWARRWRCQMVWSTQKMAAACGEAMKGLRGRNRNPLLPPWRRSPGRMEREKGRGTGGVVRGYWLRLRSLVVLAKYEYDTSFAVSYSERRWWSQGMSCVTREGGGDRAGDGRQERQRGAAVRAATLETIIADMRPRTQTLERGGLMTAGRVSVCKKKREGEEEEERGEGEDRFIEREKGMRKKEESYEARVEGRLLCTCSSSRVAAGWDDVGACVVDKMEVVRSFSFASPSGSREREGQTLEEVE